MNFFSAQNITAGYGKEKVVRSVSFEMKNGCLMGVIGANGCGKTTLLKAICGILPHEGTCTLENTSLETLPSKQMAKLCSYIPQRSGISIDIPALDVVLMGFNPHLGLLEHPGNAMRKAAYQAMEQVGLVGKEETNYQYLSEGQKQLCILARMLVSEARLLLLDEPESAVDFRYRYRMLNILRQWVKKRQGGAIITLHDPSLALNYCDRLLLMMDGEVIGTLEPDKDPTDEMEKMLCRIYGNVSLRRCATHSGQYRLVMLKEDEE